jgi:hypothetical protein
VIELYRVQSAKSRVQVYAIPDYDKTTYSVPTYISPCSIVERSAAHAFSPAWHAIAINTLNNLLSNLNGNAIAIIDSQQLGRKDIIHVAFAIAVVAAVAPVILFDVGCINKQDPSLARPP